MPELPEVETVCTELRGSILGRSFTNIEARRPNIRLPIPDLSGLVDLKIAKIERRAKYILINFQPTANRPKKNPSPAPRDLSPTLVIHLGMSGKILIGRGMEPKKHDHVIFQLDDGREMVFNDARRFGVVTLLDHAPKLLSVLGPEPFDDKFSPQYLYDALKTRKSPVKPILMDQALVVGVGNIYASEALHRSNISPLRAANKVSKRECEMLIGNIRNVLAEAIESGGSTLRDYVRSTGDSGYFQHNFAVYGRDKKPCNSCQKPIEKIVQAGRSSFYCKSCQK